MKPYYEQDGITIYHGDCREISVSGDVLVTDPPYGISYKSNHGLSIQDKRWIEGDGDASLLTFWLHRLNNTAIFFPWKHRRLIKTPNILVWNKGPAFGMGDLSFPWKRSFELIAIYGSDWIGDYRSEGVLSGTTVQSKYSGGRTHPHEKPTWLFANLIERAPGGTILDPFCGTGASLVAAARLGRKAIGIEIEERYCEIAAKRLSQRVLPL